VYERVQSCVICNPGDQSPLFDLVRPECDGETCISCTVIPKWWSLPPQLHALCKHRLDAGAVSAAHDSHWLSRPPGRSPSI